MVKIDKNAPPAVRLMRIQMVGLLSACPFSQDNPSECPLHTVRELSYQQRIEWLNTLPDEAIEYLLEHHRSCLLHKESEQTYYHDTADALCANSV